MKSLPEGEEWSYEPKLDGYRALLLKDERNVRILSRNEKDLTRMYPGIAAAALRLKAEQVVLDGEIVALAEDGRPPEGSAGLDALLVGYYEGRKLQFAGKVRAGFTPHIRRELVEKLRPLAVAACPFANLPDASAGHWGGGITADHMHEMQWIRPRLLAQVRFTEWTADKRLRHAAFLGLRIDKAARQVRRET